ncbi:MAG TPA: hypothetical protein VFE98_06300 [Candidatus Bathyarchaeia archaeon]|nr:hypothetical protein [Candidatus Bathyarchaeia archaeon]
MAAVSSRLLDTTPRWLSLTLFTSAAAVVATGTAFFFTPVLQFSFTPLTLFLHLVWAISISAWLLNLKINMSPEKKALLAIGAVVALGSAWSTAQQWIAYQQNGTVGDLILIVGTMLMDIAGGAVTYTLYHLNILKK